jgi:hypothetical protein
MFGNCGYRGVARGGGPPGRRGPVESAGGPLMACAACAGPHLQARGVGRGVGLRGRACVRRDVGQVACPGGCPARCVGTAGVPPCPHRGPAAVPARHFATGLDASAGASERPGRVEAIARTPAGIGPPRQTGITPLAGGDHQVSAAVKGRRVPAVDSVPPFVGAVAPTAPLRSPLRGVGELAARRPVRPLRPGPGGPGSIRVGGARARRREEYGGDPRCDGQQHPLTARPPA